MGNSPDSYEGGSVFTVHLRQDSAGTKFLDTGLVATLSRPNELSFDLAVVQFEDDGSVVDSKQVDSAESRIRELRQSPNAPYGILVVVLVHGWHHGGEWLRTPAVADSVADGDTHFHGFRLMLQSLTLREAERFSARDGTPTGRRVMGVYLTWNGDPRGGLWGGLARIPVLTEASFWNRYPVAESIGASADFQDTVRRIVTSVKHERGPESPLVLGGHSMGALMMQSAFATLLESGALVKPAVGNVGTGPTRLTSHGVPVLFPDLVLSINSAADGEIARRVRTAYAQLGLQKVVEGPRVMYHAPLFASVTSLEDTATGTWWPRARPGRLTDGHDASLITHNLRRVSVSGRAPCVAVQGPDFGQNWHCIHVPDPPRAASPVIPIDLPARERRNVADREVEHHQYELGPQNGDHGTPHLQWIFKCPKEVSEEHSDIFNSRARSLMLALIQISGSIASLARDWDDTFVP